MTETRIGYARLSSGATDLDDQVAALRAAGCTDVYRDQATHARAGLPRQRSAALRRLGPGNVLVVASLDRLGYNLDDLASFLGKVLATGSRLTSLEDHIDSATPQGAAALAGFVRAGRVYRSERARHGIAEGRAKGGSHGRALAVQPDQWPEMKAMIGKASVAEILEQFKISKQTFYNFRRRMEQADG
jgi:DNA invertase Pin-like site-specific DNA recombinase